jgi:hypothetical protein
MTYAHDAHCNAAHTAGPEPCPPRRSSSATPMTANPEADVIAAIDALERDEIDELVDWQMSDSPAAHVQHGFKGFVAAARRPFGGGGLGDCD